MSIKSFWKGNVLNFYDGANNPEFRTGVWANCPTLAIAADPSLASVFFDDFHSQKSTKAADADIWVVVEDDGATGTNVVTDEVGGVYNHYCDGDDNDEAYLATTGESWLMATGKPLWFETKFTFTNSGTTAGVWCVGIANGGGAANTMQDTEAGPLASYDGFFFFKESGDTSISFETSVAGTQVTNAALDDFTSGTTYRLGVYYDGVTTVTPYIDDVAGTAHTMATNTSEGNIFFGVKSNGAEEYIAMDYIKCIQMR
jgi:hypothetical protein